MDRPPLLQRRTFAATYARFVSIACRWACVAIVATVALAASQALAEHCGLNAASGDRIFLVSTRGIGTRCDCTCMNDGLRCEELAVDEFGSRRWHDTTWQEIAAQCADPMPTVVFVHGNRIDSGVDKSHGLEIYRSLAARKPHDAAVRYIIWSWPSSKVSGIVNDYQVKAARTRPVAWQLAWAIDQLPPETPLTLVGYSYGGRVVTGTLHLLAGGQLDHLTLAERVYPSRPPIRAVLVAAAVHAPWIRPGSYHGRALEQVDQLLLVNNHLDPAMRFYHLAFDGRVRPLGYDGIGRSSLGQYADRVNAIDATGAVGRSHALGDYLTGATHVGQKLERIVMAPLPTPATIEPSEEALAVGARD